MNNVHFPQERPPEQGSILTFRKNAGKWELPAGADGPATSGEAYSAAEEAEKELYVPREESASGALASFDDAAEAPVRDLTVQITPVQEGSGDPSPENIRPITGWTGANVYYSGEDTSDYETIAVTWQTEAGTVWGGTLNVTTGLLTVTHGEIESYAGEELPGTWISDRDVYAAGRTPTTGAQVVYELATPIEYHLTATEITTMAGENNVWADTGDVAVAYYADTKKYIDRLIIPPEDDMTASENIEDDTYFMIGKRLFLSTASIAQGETIVPDTNCTEMTVADAFNNL